MQVSQTLMKTFSMPDDEKVAARQALMQKGGDTANKLEIVEKMVASKTTEFFVSDKLSLADLMVFNQMSMMVSG